MWCCYPFSHAILAASSCHMLHLTRPIRLPTKDNGYSYEWVSGRKPRLTKQGRHSHAKRTTSYFLLFQGYPTSFGSNSSETSTSTSPAQERSDGLAPRRWCGSHPKTQNKNKKKDDSRDSDERLRDLPEWLEELTDNLEDTNAGTRTNFSGLRFGMSC